jgi:translation initiation factor 4A
MSKIDATPAESAATEKPTKTTTTSGETTSEDIVDTFDELNLKPDLLRGIFAYGFEKPSTIQQRAILPIIKGHEVIAQAQSGTGKTATFAISMLQRIDVTKRECQALILAPTRELAHQIQKVVIAIGDYMKVECHACIGGTNVRDDLNRLEQGNIYYIVLSSFAND